MILAFVEGAAHARTASINWRKARSADVELGELVKVNLQRVTGITLAGGLDLTSLLFTLGIGTCV